VGSAVAWRPHHRACPLFTLRDCASQSPHIRHIFPRE
jgi:hypothetical protein